MNNSDADQTISPIRLGLVINPFAGVGGPAGLKGSDDRELVEQALAAGAELRADARARRLLQRLVERVGDKVTLVTCPAAMGQAVAEECGFEVQVLPMASATHSSARDTQLAARLMLAQQLDLLLFVGGDGTARDICTVVGEQLPVLGVPAGVKMHSGVFAISPEAAAEILLAMMTGQLVDLRSREVRDIDEAALRRGVVKSRCFGQMRVPEFGHFVQSTKDGGREVEALVLEDIGAEVRERMVADTLYVLGAGTTTRPVMNELGLPSTLLGVDVICNEQLLAEDVSAPQLEALLARHPGEVVVVVSVTGGQGALFGRGNQQLSPQVLRRAGRDNVWVLATKTKIKQLQGRPLLMDSNDPQLDRDWCGYIAVITGYRDQILYPRGAPAGAGAGAADL